jgi:SAM-dependent methyltransferase
MSWDVQEADWLAEPTAMPGSGPIDALDGQVLTAMMPTQPAGPITPTMPTTPIMETPAESLPPPPSSAAFEQHERPSYESGAFVADPPAAEFSASGTVPPDAAPAPEAAESPAFHIPTLAFGVQASAPKEWVAETADPAPAVAASAPEPASETPAGLVMPTLSRMKWVPAAEAAATKAPDAPVNVAAAVYDDEDASSTEEAGRPEVVEHVDSAELELVGTDDFVIPTLARPEPADRLDISLESPAGRDDVVIPMLMRAEPAVAPEPAVTHARPPQIPPEPPEVAAEEPTFDAPEPDAPISPISPVIPPTDEVEEFEEVEAEAIESLDVADLVETETALDPEAAEPESRPPTLPPDAKPQQKRRKAWYDDVFAEHFMFLTPPTWDETTQRDAQFIHDQLGLREGASVLDVGCGDGHHAIALAKLGLHVTGVDNSLAMLLAAAQHKEAAGVDDQHVTFMHGDMRRLPRDREFQAVICVGTTFGYFEEEQNRQCLQEMFDRLAVGGRLLLHVFNRDFVAPHLPSRSWWQGRRCMVIDEAEMNFFANRLRVHRTIIFDDGRQFEHFMFMRAYTVQDLGKAMSQLGLRVVEVSGSRDTRARFYGSASPDIWIVAERK